MDTASIDCREGRGPTLLILKIVLASMILLFNRRNMDGEVLH